MNAWWKIGLILACTVTVFYSGWHVRGWKDGIAAAKLEEDQQANTIAAEKAVITKEAAANAKTQEISHAYESNIAAIDGRYNSAAIGLPSTPAPTGYGMSAVPDAASRHHAAASTDKLSGSRRTAFLALLKQADIQTQRLVACQAWVKAQQDGH